MTHRRRLQTYRTIHIGLVQEQALISHHIKVTVVSYQWNTRSVLALKLVKILKLIIKLNFNQSWTAYYNI